MRTRTSAQIRSHAQKYIIKLCKKYQIKIKSKKFKQKTAKHLDIINTNNKNFKTKSINPREKKLLDMFNYYNREYKPFLIEKSHKDHCDEACEMHLENLRKARKIKNQIFFVKKTNRRKEEVILLESKNSLNELEKIKNMNEMFLNKLEFSYTDLSSNIFTDMGTYSKHFNPNQFDRRELLYLNSMKRNVEAFESRLNSYHVIMKDFCKQIEMFCTTDCI